MMATQANTALPDSERHFRGPQHRQKSFQTETFRGEREGRVSSIDGAEINHAAIQSQLNKSFPSYATLLELELGFDS